MKRCSKCERLKNEQEFHKDKYAHDGLTVRCAECRRKNSRRWHKINSVHCSMRFKEWREANKDYDRERKKAWYLTGDRAQIECERVKQWRKENKKRCIRYNSEYRKRKPEIISAIQNRRRAKILNSVGNYTAKEWIDLKSFHGRKCLCCKRKETSKVKLTADHVVPITRGGSNHINNIQPLCMDCNRRKNVRIADYR